jgi:hypothetical protein
MSFASAQVLEPPLDDVLEMHLAAVEEAIAMMGDALAEADAVVIEAAGDHLQATLRSALPVFAPLTRQDAMPPLAQRRFALAQARISAQREALFRAASAVDHHLDILLPRPFAGASVYSANGAGQRGTGRVIAAS